MCIYERHRVKRLCRKGAKRAEKHSYWVLTRFRQEPVTFTADIQPMFYQVRVPENQRNLLRFLWWPDGDITKNVEDYRMKVHVFGAVSSPSCANYCLRKAADDARVHVGDEAANVLKKNFYVDDCLRSEETEEVAVKRVKGIRRACYEGGFGFTKFTSNSQIF